MIKTAKEIEGAVFELVKDSALSKAVNGGVYRGGNRPRDSQKEDVVVVFTGGFVEQIQTGIVTINIFVPDVDFGSNGVLLENGARVEELERVAMDWVEGLNRNTLLIGAFRVSDFHFSLQNTIYSMADPELKQHFVVVKLKYRLLTVDNLIHSVMALPDDEAGSDELKDDKGDDDYDSIAFP